MGFTDASFEGVWAYTSLLHIPKSEVGTAFSEMRRVLKDRGILGLGLIEGDTEEYLASTKISMPRWFSYYSKNEIESLLLEYGFEVLYFETFNPGRRNYLNFITKKL